MTAVHAATIAERREALQAGAALLRSVWPKVTTDGHVLIGPNTAHVRFSMEFNGAIRAVCRYTGHLVAQSRPGQHLRLDPAVHTDLFAPINEDELVDKLRRNLETQDVLLLVADALEDRHFSDWTAAELAEAIRNWSDRLTCFD